MSKLKILIVSAFITLVAGAFFLPSVFAQTPSGLDLTVSPPVIELNAKPGDTVTERFRVRNNQSQPTDLTLDTKKLSSDSTTGEPVPAEPTSEDEYIKWLTIDPAAVTVLPNEWADIDFTIEIPENAAYGYYYVIRIQPASQQEVKGSGTTVKGQVFVVVLLNVVKDGAKAKADLVEFKPDNFISEYLPVEFTAKISNSGNVHVKPAGNIFIRSLAQKDVAIIDINAGRQTVLPGGSRTFTSTWDDGFIVRQPVIENGVAKLDSNGKVVTKLTFNWDSLTHFRIGPYTANLLMVYDDGKKDATIEGTATFWLIPYTAIIVIIISLIIIFFILRFILKWYVGREVRRQKGR